MCRWTRFYLTGYVLRPSRDIHSLKPLTECGLRIAAICAIPHSDDAFAICSCLVRYCICYMRIPFQMLHSQYAQCTCLVRCCIHNMCMPCQLSDDACATLCIPCKMLLVKYVHTSFRCCKCTMRILHSYVTCAASAYLVQCCICIMRIPC